MLTMQNALDYPDQRGHFGIACCLCNSIQGMQKSGRDVNNKAVQVEMPATDVCMCCVEEVKLSQAQQ